MNLTVEERFEPYRSGDIVLSAGEGIGDLIIFFGRHSTIEHSAVLVWLDKEEADKGNLKVSKSDLSTSKGVVHKYTFDVVEKAIEVEKLFEQQLKDKEKEERANKKANNNI